MTRFSIEDWPAYSIERRALLKATAWGVAAPALSAWSGPARALVSPLERPADMTKRAARAVMTRLARAGRRLVAVGERGMALWSDDDGRRWQQAKVPVSVTLTSALFIDERLGWATGHGGVVLHSADGGETWARQLDGIALAQLVLAQAKQLAPGAERETRVQQAQRLVGDGPDKPLLALHFVDARRGLAVGAYGLAVATTDGGKTWRPCMERFDNPRSMHLYGLANVGASWVVAGEQGFLARSSDGGGRFARLDAPYKGSFFTLMSTREGEMLAAGLLGNVCRFDPVAGVVSPVDLPGKATILSALQLRNGLVVLVEGSGRLLVSKNGGRTFAWATVSGQGPLTAVVETDDGALCGAGVAGVRRLTIDISNLL